ncbi:uncharacterized protein (DUF1800 family) [Lewinella aquimaris]|uniref:Uncharacterized protein (DUF1800 family) n=1 Tax=Neolewinella aquimaris TaxID=1835722 RepID=A0A840DW95_9BACT|nr:DUF1800 family protein [Neolewinella aquimaris]MBB4077444.1 uncharacterized protein (DUF1800 family) [Neolewinella aquimaris]
MTALHNLRPPAVGLAPYTGTFGRPQAAHLLRRTLMGATITDIDGAVNQGLAATIDQLLAPAALPPPPVNHFFTDDPNVPVGETWINAPWLNDTDVGEYRWPSIRGWYMNGLIDSQSNIIEKMALFWINHFGIAAVNEQRAEYDFIQLCRQYATGNFRDLIKEITVLPSMLAFLNGRFNHKDAPDENYARELLELFTVQKGRPGDVNYTEDDIRAIARVLTGWRELGFYSTQHNTTSSYFQASWHDTGSKQLSAHFNNAVITDGGADEYKTLIDIIFQHPETPRALCRDLYTYFVGHQIDDDIEANVIDPLAELFVNSDFELAPVLENLLQSDHFFADEYRGTIIKNPYEFLLSMTRPFGGYGYLNLNLLVTYHLGTSYHWWAETMDMDFLMLPSVSGWKAYYQSPGYYRNWISSPTLQRRRTAVQAITNNGIYTEGQGRPLDFLAFIDGLTQPSDVNVLLEDVSVIFLAQPPHADQLSALKDILLPGLPDFEWTIQYEEYRDNPNDSTYVDPILRKLKAMFRALFSMAEFHLQ